MFFQTGPFVRVCSTNTIPYFSAQTCWMYALQLVQRLEHERAVMMMRDLIGVIQTYDYDFCPQCQQPISTMPLID